MLHQWVGVGQADATRQRHLVGQRGRGGETVATLWETEPRILNLPASFRNPRRFRFDTGISRIPSVIAPATWLFEKTVLEALYTWLNSEYSTGLAPPNLCRLGGELGPAARKGRVFLIRASHTAYIVAKADNRATHLLPRWKPATDVATLLASRLDTQCVCNEDTVVLDLLSNTMLMGSDESGMQAYPFKDATGHHVPGNMEGAPTGVLKAAVKMAKPILSAAAKAGKIIVVDPLPRYISGKCCPSPDHISNFGDADYQETIEAAVRSAHKALVADLAAVPKTTFLDTMEGFQAMEGCAVSRAGRTMFTSPPQPTATCGLGCLRPARQPTCWSEVRQHSDTRPSQHADQQKDGQ